MGPESWDSPLLLEEGINGSKSVYFPSDFHSGERADPVSAEFASRFSAWLSADEARLELNGGNNYTSAASALAYDGYMLVVQAIRNAGSAEPSAVAATLASAGYQGVTGKLVFNEQGESVRKQMLIKTIDRKTGQFTVLQTSAVGG
jgi:branched-chain amino acid transport system substrate-binding protein